MGRQTSLAEEIAGTEHRHDGFSPRLREHRQLHAARLNVEDLLAGVPLREDGLSAPILHRGSRNTRRIEKLLDVERRDGSRRGARDLSTIHVPSMTRGRAVGVCTSEQTPRMARLYYRLLGGSSDQALTRARRRQRREEIQP